MKTFGKYWLAATVLAITLVSGSTLRAQSAPQMQEEFFTAIASEDPQELLALCRADLRGLIDEPVLAAWMQAFHRSVGEYQKLDTSDFSVKYSVSNTGQQVSVAGTVVCTKGNARSELVAQDGKLISWRANSELLPEDWFQGPLTHDLYRQRSEKFITRCFGEKTEAAYNQMHSALQDVVSRDEFAEMIAVQQEDGGVLKDMIFRQAEMDFSDGQRLNVYYELEMENVNKMARIQFQFDGLRGHLIGYRFWNP